MKFKNVKVYGLYESMIRSGYPMQVGEPTELKYEYPFQFVPDERDDIRAKALAKAPTGSGHNNFLKGVIVQFDLQYPEYFSPQLQRYHWVDIVSSQSKMHKITSRSLSHLDFTEDTFKPFIDTINAAIGTYNAKSTSKEERELLFKQIISSLPSGYLKWMGISTNYLQLKTIYNQRKNHKLSEWREFCEWIKTLPMSELITGNYDT